MRLSVVITAYNEQENIGDCLESLKGLNCEIVVVDNSSDDKTKEIAEKYTKKVFEQKNDPKRIDIQKNLGFGKATGEWILSLDADERVTPELKKEIESRIKNQELGIMGYEIPRKNIIFGKWIQYTGWYPDYQLKLFKKGKGKFVAQKVHEPLVVDGKIEKLLSSIHHENYQSVNQFLERMISYTDSEAAALISSKYELNYIDSIRMPFQEFLRRFFMQEGYKDGLHGLVLSLLMAFYHLIIFVKVWEKRKFNETQENILEGFSSETKKIRKELSYWAFRVKEKETRNPIQKILLKVRRYD